MLCALKEVVGVKAVKGSGAGAVRQGHSSQGEEKPPGVARGPALGCGLSRQSQARHKHQSRGALKSAGVAVPH